MNQPSSQDNKGPRGFINRLHTLTFVVEVGLALVPAVAYYFFGPVPNWPFRLPSEESRLILAVVIAVVLLFLFSLIVTIYRKTASKDGTFNVGQLAFGLFRGWPGDTQDKSARSHKVLVISDSSDPRVKEESDAACKEISGPGLESIAFDPCKKDAWKDVSADVSAIYLFRTRNMVEEEQRKWIYPALLELSKTRNNHSPVVEADMYADQPGTQVFYRIQKDAFSKKIHVLLFRAIERAALMSSQAGFNRFVVFLFVAAALTVFVVGRLPFPFGPSPSATEMANLKDLVNSLHGERDLLEQCFPLTPTISADHNCRTSLDLIEATRRSINLELMKIRETKRLRTNPRLTVWRSTTYKGHAIILAAGASEDPQAHVFLDDPPNDPKKRRTDRDSIIGGAFYIRGWVLWRSNCPARQPAAAWTMERRIIGHCDQDGTIKTLDSTIKYQDISSVPLSALLCYGDGHGDGACVAVTDDAKLLEDESLRQDVASWTRLIAGKPTSLLFGQDLRKRADELVESRTSPIGANPQS